MGFVIDAHCHIYPEAIAEKAARNTGMFYAGLPATCKGTVEALIAEGDGCGIDHFVVQSVSTKWEQVQSINEFIASEVKKNPKRLTGFATMHPDSSNLEGDMEHALELGLKGVKLHPDIQRFALDGKGGMAIMELCQRYHLPVLIHAGDSRFQYSNPDNIIPVLERFPDLVMVGAHFGGFSVWDEALIRLAKYPNFYVDSSSTMFAMEDEKVMELIDGWGSARILFASDYPMWSPIAERQRYEGLPLTDGQKKQIDYENAMRIFKIDPEILVEK